MNARDRREIAMRQSQLIIDGPVVELSHQRTEARHPLSIELAHDYIDALDIIRDDISLRALIITGTGGCFSAGGDLKGLRERITSEDDDLRTPDHVRRRLDTAQGMLARLRETDVPVIAAVDGHAFGAGFGLALQADFLLASTRALFCMAFARIGAVPDYGVFYTLPRVVGMARAKEIAMTARRIRPEEGKGLGFVHSIHEPAELLPQAHALARRLSTASRQAQGLTKRLFNRSFETEYVTLATLEANAQALCLTSDYSRAAVNRFLNKEPALFELG
jgi:enoyl-CoA hydratase/carnithine racemase